MLELLSRLRVEMNGAVVEAMETRGISYTLSYGVSIPTIRDIAAAYHPDHELARFLFVQQVRELMLCAVYIDDPKRVTPAQMKHWGQLLDNAELTEHVATGLFAGAPASLSMALEWMEEESPFLVYAGFLMAGKKLADPNVHETVWAADVVTALDRALRSADHPGYARRAAATALARCAACSPLLLGRVRKIAESYRSLPALREVAEELSWQLDELTRP